MTGPVDIVNWLYVRGCNIRRVHYVYKTAFFFVQPPISKAFKWGVAGRHRGAAGRTLCNERRYVVKAIRRER